MTVEALANEMEATKWTHECADCCAPAEEDCACTARRWTDDREEESAAESMPFVPGVL